MKGFAAHIRCFRCSLQLASLSSPLCSSERVEDLPKPTDYVSDFAMCSRPRPLRGWTRSAPSLTITANAQIACHCPHAGCDDAADYATALRQWKSARRLGPGVLVLLAVDDHKYRIEPATAGRHSARRQGGRHCGRWFPLCAPTIMTVCDAVGDEVAQVIASDAK